MYTYKWIVDVECAQTTGLERTVLHSWQNDRHNKLSSTDCNKASNLFVNVGSVDPTRDKIGRRGTLSFSYV